VIGGLAIVARSLLGIHETVRVSSRFDLAGTLTSTTAMTSLVFGFNRAGEQGWQTSRMPKCRPG
jgi:hypothetical protein